MSTNPQGTVGKLTAWKTTPSALIVAPDFNVRFDMGDLSSLSQSIVDNGVERPLNVIRGAEGEFQVIDGHRRLAAIQLAVKAGKIDATTFPVPIMIADRGMSEEDQIAMMARANDGKPLLPLEQAALFKRLVDKKVTMKDICKLVGHTDTYVRQHLDLLSADPTVKDALAKGEISKTLALNISTQAKRGKINAADLVAQAKSGKAGKQAATLATDTFQAKQRAIKVKLNEIQTTLTETTAKVKEALEAAGMTRAALKDAKHYELIRLLGQESALRKLVNDHKAEE